MSDQCNFYLKVKGNRKNVDRFIADILETSDSERHFWRIISTEVLKKHEKKYKSSAEISGVVAHSFWTGFFGGDGTYQRNNLKNGNRDPMGTDILSEARRLDLRIEVFAETSGPNFEEHYLIKQGSLKVSDLRYYWYDEDDEDIHEDEDKIGGFKWKFSL